MIDSIIGNSGRKIGYLRPSKDVAGGLASNFGDVLFAQDVEVEVGD